jgi:hypothetical protein
VSKIITLELTVDDKTYPPALAGSIMGFINYIEDVRVIKVKPSPNPPKERK